MYYHVNNVRLNVVDEGKGSPALVFLHFWGGSLETWAGVAKVLNKEHRTVRYDQRGWGFSDKPATGYNIASLAKDALALIDELKLGSYILIGHSMGGKVVQYIAGLRPQGLQKAVLVAPSPASPTIVPESILAGMKGAYTSLEGIERTIDVIFRAGDLEPAVRERVIADIQRHNQYSLLGWLEGGMQEDVSEGLSRIDVPVLVIAGERDIVDTPERLEAEVVRKIQGARMVVIPGAGHLSMVQAPLDVAREIATFVAEAAVSRM